MFAIIPRKQPKFLSPIHFYVCVQIRNPAISFESSSTANHREKFAEIRLQLPFYEKDYNSRSNALLFLFHSSLLSFLGFGFLYQCGTVPIHCCYCWICKALIRTSTRKSAKLISSLFLFLQVLQSNHYLRLMGSLRVWVFCYLVFYLAVLPESNWQFMFQF